MATLKRTLWAVLVFGLLAAGCARAAGPQPASIRLIPYLQVAPGTASARDVVAGKVAFKPFTPAILNGWPADFWMRFTMRSAGAGPGEWLLLLPIAERAEFYSPRSPGGSYRAQFGGTSTAFVDHTLPYVLPAFLIDTNTPLDAPLYAHVVIHPDQAFAPMLRSERAYIDRIKVGRLFEGFFLGAMLAVVFFNLYAFFGLREYPAIFFVIYAAALAANEIVATGIGGEYLWPHFAGDPRLAVLITNSLGFASFLLFARAFLLTRATVRTLDTIIIATLVVQLAVAAVQYAFPVGRALVVPLLGIELAGALIMAGIGIVRWYQGFRPARFFVIAFVPSTIGVLANLYYNAFLPHGNWFFAAYGVEFGVILQSVVISFSVIDRIHILDHERRRAQHIASTDALTGIANRLAFYEAVQDAISHAAIRENFGILFIDLDGFKPVNDRYGHRVGDELLRIIAQRLEAAVRSDDLVARVGGDEFAVLLRRAPSAGLLRRIAEGARTSVTEPMVIDGAFVRVGASVGIALFPNDGTDADALVDAADREMYEEKQLHKKARSL